MLEQKPHLGARHPELLRDLRRAHSSYTSPAAQTPPANTLYAPGKISLVSVRRWTRTSPAAFRSRTYSAMQHPTLAHLATRGRRHDAVVLIDDVHEPSAIRWRNRGLRSCAQRPRRKSRTSRLNAPKSPRRSRTISKTSSLSIRPYSSRGDLASLSCAGASPIIPSEMTPRRASSRRGRFLSGAEAEPLTSMAHAIMVADGQLQEALKERFFDPGVLLQIPRVIE